MPSTYFITQELFNQAVDIIRPSIEAVLGTDLVGGRKSLYLVVGNTAKAGTEFEVLFGAPRETWAHKYDDFARGKADICSRTGKPSGHVVNRTPWELVSGDPLYAGGVIEDGLVVASSGLQEHFDEMISWMFLSILGGLATDAVKKAKENQKSGFLDFEYEDVGDK